jgi:hypothetical protein
MPPLSVMRSKNKILLSLLFILPLLWVYGSEPRDSSILDVSIFEILANPEKFVEKKVRVVGIAASDGDEDWVQILAPSLEYAGRPIPGYYFILNFDSDKMKSSIKKAEEYKDHKFSEERLNSFFDNPLDVRRFWWNFRGKSVMITGTVKKSYSLFPNWKGQYSIENVEELHPL